MASSSSPNLSLIDQSWELIDPCPDIRSLFVQFDSRFFYGALGSCEVRWSPRMTLCAGQCHYESRGGYCSIRLSEPLLKLRPRKDLIETLLHEMIHAYLFVTDNNRDHDGHGPEFQKHMHRINAETATKITIYHSFHDEVANYKTHWWRCEGPCKDRPPYHGYVKRAMNRAPGPNDTWWSDHQRACGGNFVKVKEPENFGVKKSKTSSSGSKKAEKKQDTSKQRPLDAFFGKGYVLGGSAAESSKENSSNISTTNPQKKNKIGKKPVTIPSDNSKYPEDEESVMVACPSCTDFVPESNINQHLDSCLA